MSEMLSRLLAFRLGLLSSQLSKNLCIQAKSPPVELAYSCFQPTRKYPKEPPLVILHGLFGSKRNWESLARHFSNGGRKVITVDARNHGESSHADAMDYLTMSQDVERLLDKLSIRNAIVLGHSMGGKTAMCLALNNPDLVEALIVEDVVPNSTRTAVTTSFPQYITAMKNVNFSEDLKTLGQARQIADKQLHKAFPDAFVRAFILSNIREGSKGFEWKINLESVEQHLDELVGFPDIQKSYNREVLFIGGANSNHITEADEPAIKRLFPKAQVSRILGAGHWVHSDKPKELLEMVQTFIGDHS